MPIFGKKENKQPPIEPPKKIELTADQDNQLWLQQNFGQDETVAKPIMRSTLLRPEAAPPTPRFQALAKPKRPEGIFPNPDFTPENEKFYNEIFGITSNISETPPKIVDTSVGIDNNPKTLLGRVQLAEYLRAQEEAEAKGTHAPGIAAPLLETTEAILKAAIERDIKKTNAFKAQVSKPRFLNLPDEK